MLLFNAEANIIEQNAVISSIRVICVLLKSLSFIAFDHPILQCDHASCPVDHTLIMRGEYEGDAFLFVQPRHNVQKVESAFAVEVGGGFIRKNKIWF